MRSHDPLYLALDQGGHSSRAMAFNAQGTCVAMAQVPIATQVYREHGVEHIEHDARELAQSLRDCCEQIASELGHQVTRIRAGGLATQRSSIVCWRRTDGQPLTPVISWQDRRAEAITTRLAPHQTEIAHRTGLVLSPHYGASKLRWCLDQVATVDDARNRGDLTLGPLASYLVRALTDADSDRCDPANASRTLLWDRHKRDWSIELCALFGIDPALLPHSVPTRSAFGQLNVGTHRVPLTVLTGDQSAAIYAFGPLQPDTAFVNLGTGAFMQFPVGEQSVSVEGLLSSVVYRDEQRLDYVLEGTVNGAGRALSWWSRQHGLDNKRLTADATAHLARHPDSRASFPIFMNGLSGLGSPYWISDFPTRFVDANTSESVVPDPVSGVIAVLDSIAFLIAVNLATAASAGWQPSRVILTGGLASVDYLCQTLADASAVTTSRSPVREATARGVGYLVSQSTVWPGLDALTDFQPDAASSTVDLFEHWQRCVARHVQAAMA